MKIYIEVLVLICFVIVLIIGTAIKLFTGWLGRRRYKPENDRSRLGEEERIRRGTAEVVRRIEIPRSSFISPVAGGASDYGNTGTSSQGAAGNQQTFKGIFRHLNRT